MGKAIILMFYHSIWLKDMEFEAYPEPKAGTAYELARISTFLLLAACLQPKWGFATGSDMPAISGHVPKR